MERQQCLTGKKSTCSQELWWDIIWALEPESFCGPLWAGELQKSTLDWGPCGEGCVWGGSHPKAVGVTCQRTGERGPL